MSIPLEFWQIVAIGFAAQLVDGALGMAYGVTASTLLLGMGVPPAVTSATVHAAECFTTGASATSHHAFGNIDKKLFRRLLLPAVAGAALGAWLLSRVDGDAIKPWVAAYLLLMGALIISLHCSRQKITCARRVANSETAGFAAGGRTGRGRRPRMLICTPGARR